MNYIDQVGSSFESHTSPNILSADTVEQALTLRHSDDVRIVIEGSAPQLELGNFSPEDQALFQSRTVGNMAVRLALASSASMETVSFFDLSDDERLDTLASLSQRYTRGISQKLDEGSLETSGLLTLQSEADPLYNISHKLTRSLVFNARLAQIPHRDRLKMIMSYANVLPGTFPPSSYAIKPLGVNDTVLVQAFGRDSITDEELPLVRDERLKLSSDDEMMRHLEITHFNPGPSNESLADEVDRQLQSNNPTEQIIQWEVAYALYANHPSVYGRYRQYLHILWPRRDFYPTYEVTAHSIDVMDEYGLYNPKELAHGDMMVRAIGIINKLGSIADPVDVEVPFDPESTQPHVRNKWPWAVREVLARSEHVLKNRIKF